MLYTHTTVGQLYKTLSQKQQNFRKQPTFDFESQNFEKELLYSWKFVSPSLKNGIRMNNGSFCSLIQEILQLVMHWLNSMVLLLNQSPLQNLTIPSRQIPLRFQQLKGFLAGDFLHCHQFEVFPILTGCWYPWEKAPGQRKTLNEPIQKESKMGTLKNNLVLIQKRMYIVDIKTEIGLRLYQQAYSTYYFQTASCTSKLNQNSWLQLNFQRLFKLCRYQYLR